VSSCTLCGLPLADPSREHVIPQWARREFDIQGNVTIQAGDGEARAEPRQVGAMQHLNVTLDDAICKLAQFHDDSSIAPRGPACG
jgi:hypothetical protein